MEFFNRIGHEPTVSADARQRTVDPLSTPCVRWHRPRSQSEPSRGASDNSHAAPADTTQPPVGSGKCVPSTSTLRSACSARKRRRVRRAVGGSTSNRVARSGSQHCSGWCIKSPVITASCPCEWMRTLTCPGVWPGVGSRRTSAVSAWSVSTHYTRPASMTGCTESTIACLLEASRACDQCSYSTRPNR